MGKNVPSYRIALEWEIDTWKAFRNSLTPEEDVRTFDMPMDMAMAHASVGGCAVNPVLFEPMLISIVLHLKKQIQALEADFSEFLRKKSTARVDLQEPKVLNGVEAYLKPSQA